MSRVKTRTYPLSEPTARLSPLGESVVFFVKPCAVTTTPSLGRVGRAAGGEGNFANLRLANSHRPLRACGSTLPEGECRFFVKPCAVTTTPSLGRVGRAATGEGNFARMRLANSHRLLRAYGSTLPQGGECLFVVKPCAVTTTPSLGRVGRAATGEGNVADLRPANSHHPLR